MHFRFRQEAPSNDGFRLTESRAMNNLELIVDQPVPGHFYWTLIDLGQAGEPHRVLGYAQGPLSTRCEADAQGQTALRQHLHHWAR